MTRRGYVAGGLAALVLALVTWGVVQQVRETRDEPAVRPVPADAAYGIDGPLTCDSELHEVPHLPLEAEPITVLVCADPAGSQPWTAPHQLIEGDLSELVGALSDLEPAPPGDYPCTMQAGPAYDLLLRFSRDRFARIHGDTGGCGVVSVASGDFFGAGEVLDAALGLVERQRASSEPPATVEPVDLDCNVGGDSAPPLSLTGEVRDVARLVSCWQPNADELPPFPPGTEVRPRDVRALAADMAANAFESKRVPPLRCPGGIDHHYFHHLYGQTRWGDLVAVYGECRRFGFPAPDARWWTPSPPSQRILDVLRR